MVPAPGVPADVDRALAARALAWLAQREYSRNELRDKLLRYRPLSDPLATASLVAAGATVAGRKLISDRAPDAASAERGERRTQVQRVDAVLDWLERNQHLSQRRFVESRLHSRSERFGNARIRQELARHGVSISAELDASLRASEFDRARGVWQRKFGNLATPTSSEVSAKQVRFMTGRGFSGDVIRRVLRELAGADVNAPRDPAEGGRVDESADAASGGDLRTRSARGLRLIAGGKKKPHAD